MTKGLLVLSRFTPGLANAVDVGLQAGDRVEYRMRTGEVITATLTSSKMLHHTGAYGHDAIFDDDGQRGFADEQRIIGWKGKC